jgi:hypothetical protein
LKISGYLSIGFVANTKKQYQNTFLLQFGYTLHLNKVEIIQAFKSSI